MAVTTLLQLARIGVLARLLEPAAFGQMALVLIVAGCAHIAGDLGLSDAVIQRPRPSREELSSLFGLSILSGIGVFAILWLSAPLLAGLLRAEEIAGLLRLSGLVFLLLPLGAQTRALLEKDLRFGRLAALEIAGALVNTLVAVGCALAGRGVWSLAAGFVADAATRSIGCLVLGRTLAVRPALRFWRADIGGYVRFGLHRSGAVLINFLDARLDQLIIGAALGDRALGYYSVAFHLVMQPVQKLHPVLTRVSFPLLARFQGDASRVRRGFLRLVFLMMSIHAPILIGGAAVAPAAVPLLLGAEWQPAVLLVQILAFYALGRSTGPAGGSLLLASGRPDRMLRWNLLQLLVTPPVVISAARSGDPAVVAASLGVLQAGWTLAGYGFIVRPLAGPCARAYFGAMGAPLGVALAMGLAVTAASSITARLAPAADLAIRILAGAAVYTGLLLIVRREDIASLKEGILPDPRSDETGDALDR